MSENWKRILVRPEQPIREVLQVIDNEALRIALVANSHGTLQGVVTDGDIRRGLLKDIQLNHPIASVMHKTPVTASVLASRKEIRQLMEKHKLLAIPILDDQQQVVGLETLQSVMQKPQYKNPVLLMAGGYGTRLRPLTNDCPKPLLRVGDKPILEIMLSSFIKAGFVDFYISTHYLSQMVEDYFGDGSKWGVRIQYLYEEQPLGTAGALTQLPATASSLPVIVMNGDILTNIDFERVLNFHNKNGAAATMCVRDYEYQVPYGVVLSNGHRVTGLEEKPVQRFFVNTGIYVIGAALRSQLAKNKAVDMPDLLNEAMARQEPVLMCPVHEYWLDIGRLDDFNRAQIEIADLSF